MWALAFVVLELLGLRAPNDDSFTLTNRIRALMRSRWGKVLTFILFVGWLWLGWHFFLVDPVVNPGA